MTLFFKKRSRLEVWTSIWTGPDIGIFRISAFSGYRHFPVIGRPDIRSLLYLQFHHIDKIIVKMVIV